MVFVGRKGVAKYGGTTIGVGQNITLGASGEVIKDWSMDQLAPELVEYGNQSYPVSIGKMYVDKEYASLVLGGSKINIEVRPEGTATGAAKAVLLKGVVLPNWELTMTRDGAILESVSGEALSARFTTVA